MVLPWLTFYILIFAPLLLDRINTQEMTPANLTNWGFQLTQGEASHHGRILPKLINLHLDKANPNGEPAFTEKELKSLFTIPE